MIQGVNRLEKAKVSIIVPIYNVEKYVEKCLESLLNQTFKEIEIWAISDGSPDNSINIVKKYSEKDKRVKCIEKENGGYGSVLEYAISKIETPYFLICDPDDWIKNDAIEKLYNIAVKNDVDFVRAGYYKVFSDNGTEIYNSGVLYENIYSPVMNAVYTDDLIKLLFLSESPHAKLYKTDLAKNIKFPKKVSFTDGVLYKLYIPKIKSAYILEDGLAFYLIDREGNTVTDVKPKIIDQHYVVFKSIMEQYEKYDKKSDWFYYRMLLQCEFVNSELGKIADRKDYLAKRKVLWKMYKDCRKYKKQIYNCLRYESKRKRVAHKLLLNCIFGKITFIYFSNKVWKK